MSRQPEGRVNKQKAWEKRLNGMSQYRYGMPESEKGGNSAEV